MTTLQERVNNAGFGHFIKQIFPNYKVQKISLITSLVCPNVNPITKQVGCTYCNNATFSPTLNLKNKSILQQLQEGINFFRYKYPDMHYLAYFQSYTSTFGSLKRLIAQYNDVLDADKVEGLVIATRPDMMPDYLLDYLEEIAKEKFVLVEYGIESTLNETLKKINRGHSYECAVDTILRTAGRGIFIGGHLILGLPGESRQEMLRHAENINLLPLDILKLHQLQIIKDTPMAVEYSEHPEHFSLPSAEEYADLCLDFLELLREDIALDRFLSSSPADLLIAPRWNIKNYAFQAILKRQIGIRTMRDNIPKSN